MNALSYTVLRLARSVGVNNRHMHLRAARNESTLLSEAEDLLGHMAWEDVEEVVDLAEEYWSIVELEGQKGELYDEIRTLEEENRKLSDEHEDPRASRPAEQLERSAVMERRRIYYKGQAPIAAKLRGLEVFDYKINVFDKYIELDVDDQEPWGTTCERLEALGFTMSDDDL